MHTYDTTHTHPSLQLPILVFPMAFWAPFANEISNLDPMSLGSFVQRLGIFEHALVTAHCPFAMVAPPAVPFEAPDTSAQVATGALRCLHSDMFHGKEQFSYEVAYPAAHVPTITSDICDSTPRTNGEHTAYSSTFVTAPAAPGMPLVPASSSLAPTA